MYLFAFRSRTQAMKLYDNMRGSIRCDVINTPSNISQSCGLSVKVEDSYYERAFEIFEYVKPEAVIGVYYCSGEVCKRVE